MSGKVRRAIAALGACAVLLVAVVAPPATTDAAFTDAERASSGQFGTVVLAPPEVTSIVTCTRPALGNTYLVVEWRWPSAARPYDDPARVSTVWTVQGSTQTPTTVALGGGAYRSAFVANQGLISLLVNLLLGGTVNIQSWTTWTAAGASQPWRSADVERINMRIGTVLEGFATTCSLP